MITSCGILLAGTMTSYLCLCATERLILRVPPPCLFFFPSAFSAGALTPFAALAEEEEGTYLDLGDQAVLASSLALFLERLVVGTDLLLDDGADLDFERRVEDRFDLRLDVFLEFQEGAALQGGPAGR